MSSATATTLTSDKAIDEACRLDVWLFRTRLLKTRSLAAKMILKKKMRVFRNGQTERVKKPHTLIRPGDQVTFMRGEDLISVKMLSSGTRRGPATEARTLYKPYNDLET